MFVIIWPSTNDIYLFLPFILQINVMDQNFSIERAQFFTATIFQRNHLLSDDNSKNIIVESSKFLVTGNESS
jgi:hypothetical protein